MRDITKELEALRGFWRRQFPKKGGRGDRQTLAALTGEMVTWAQGIDCEVEPCSLEDAVVRAAACIIRAACAEGQSAAYEVLIFPPEQKTHVGSGQWRLCWEAGPSNWAISGEVVPFRYRGGPLSPNTDWYVEPYYGFDLCYCND